MIVVPSWGGRYSCSASSSRLAYRTFPRAWNRTRLVSLLPTEHLADFLAPVSVFPDFLAAVLRDLVEDREADYSTEVHSYTNMLILGQEKIMK